MKNDIGCGGVCAPPRPGAGGCPAGGCCAESRNDPNRIETTKPIETSRLVFIKAHPSGRILPAMETTNSDLPRRLKGTKVFVRGDLRVFVPSWLIETPLSIRARNRPGLEAARSPSIAGSCR